MRRSLRCPTRTRRSPLHFSSVQTCTHSVCCQDEDCSYTSLLTRAQYSLSDLMSNAPKNACYRRAYCRANDRSDWPPRFELVCAPAFSGAMTPTVSPIVSPVFRQFKAVCNGPTQLQLLHARPLSPDSQGGDRGRGAAERAPGESLTEQLMNNCRPGSEHDHLATGCGISNAGDRDRGRGYEGGNRAGPRRAAPSTGKTSPRRQLRSTARRAALAVAAAGPGLRPRSGR